MQEIARRRVVALGAVAAAALAGGAAIGSGGEEQPRRRAAAAPASTPPPTTPSPKQPRLPLVETAGALVVLRFSGPSPPAYVERALRTGWATGVILFRDNITSPAQLRRLTRRLQRAAGGDALICTDQEGGAIRNLRWGSPLNGQGTLRSPSAAAASARAAARTLREAGINVNLAPVADVSAGPASIMRTRAYAGGTAAVSAATRAAVRAYRGTGVLPTVKHFPGLGAATENTDFRPATIGRDARALGATDLPPFAAAVKAGVPLVMMSHALYPSLDRDRIASQSDAIVTGLLRKRLRFAGVVMTDSLEARAVKARSGPEEAAVRSIRAGVDVILTTGAGSHLRVVRALATEARRSRAFRARLRESASRVLGLRGKLR